MLSTESGAFTAALPRDWSEGDFWIHHGRPRIVLRDEGTVVVGGRQDCNYEPEGSTSCWRCSFSLELSRLDAAGAAVGPTRSLPTEWLGEEQITFAAAVIATGDYALAYSDPDGLRLMRVRVP